MIDTDSITSEQAFDIMDRVMPGEEAIRMKSEGIQDREVMEAFEYLYKLKRADFIDELDYYPRKLIIEIIETLVCIIDRYT